MPAPAVSIIIPSYNYGRYLPLTLRSALGQTLADVEVIAVDDGSTDESLQILREVAEQDARLRVFTHPDGKNRGLPATLALALSHAKGEWLAVLEADDLWLPTCLEERLHAACQTGADVVLNDISLLAMPGAATGWFESYVPRVMDWHRAQAQGEDGQARSYAPGPAFLLENKIPTLSCAMVRTSLMRSISLQSPVRRWLDWWLWAQLSLENTFAFVPQRLTRWRLHASSQHAREEPGKYLDDYARMGQGLRKLWLRPLLRGRCWGWAAFLCLPSLLRVGLRLGLGFLTQGPWQLSRGIWGRLRFSGRGLRKL
ncbi:MAG: glycosyltransferase family 2 protein [Desulfovibrio sp.]|nr:glycosyltransferase family 2 protein [Desulfovibrio sp.]